MYYDLEFEKEFIKYQEKEQQEEVKKLYIDTDDKMIFSKRDKMSIRLSLGSLKIFQITFSFYVKLKPYVSAFKKR